MSGSGGRYIKLDTQSVRPVCPYSGGYGPIKREYVANFEVLTFSGIWKTFNAYGTLVGW